jgi:hypothetical protein
MTVAVVRFFKLRLHEMHIRIGYSDDPLGQPGVDVRGPAAQVLLEHARPLQQYVRELDPTYVLRTVSADWRSGKLILVLAPAERPHCLPRELRTMQLGIGDAQPAWTLAEALLPELTTHLHLALAARVNAVS